MKKTFSLIVLIFSLICINGCISKEGYPTTFEKEYKKLELETRNYTDTDFYDADKRSADDKRALSEGDRMAAIAEEAQKERRAKTVVESDYYFQVYPGRKESYSYNEYNEVWSDGYPLNAYKETQRLWKKPQKFKPEDYEGIPDDGLVTEQAIAAAEEAARKAEQEAAAAVENDAVYE
ncbi:MAG: hypothetical protein J5594_04070 [Elusimicrobiaceae bacterium]|nr:hypothetical protein [Elusimicrobiaceae bacterium]